jgi:hypothetical protein
VDAARAVESTLIGSLLLAGHSAPVPAEAGAIVFRSGIAAYWPGPNGSLLAALNGAPASSAWPAARLLSAGRIGRTKDIADAIIALLRNGFITDTVLHADGGHRLVLGRG